MPRFFITGKLEVYVQIGISADNFEDAVKKSKDLNVTDFIEMKGSNEWIDGIDPEIVVISKED